MDSVGGLEAGIDATLRFAARAALKPLRMRCFARTLTALRCHSAAYKQTAEHTRGETAAATRLRLPAYHGASHTARCNINTSLTAMRGACITRAFSYVTRISRRYPVTHTIPPRAPPADGSDNSARTPRHAAHCAYPSPPHTHTQEGGGGGPHPSLPRPAFLPASLPLSLRCCGNNTPGTHYHAHPTTHSLNGVFA